MAGRRDHGGTGAHAALVAAGILASRVAGLVRDRVFAHYFGNSAAADAFRAAMRIPNILQNLFGEGALSASFIPVYSKLLAKGERETADAVARSIFWLLAAFLSLLVAVGILAAPWLIALIAPGFTGEKRALTVTLVRIFFPSMGVMALSAWCLGVLNSHRRFFLSYAASVVWNAAIVAALLRQGPSAGDVPLAVAGAWGAVAGSILMLAVQLPKALAHLGPSGPSAGARPHLRTVVASWFPAFASRGVMQISAYVDSLVASLLPTGAMAALTYSQALSVLPASLFGLSVSAAELPALSGEAGDREALRRRIDTALARIAFFVVPSAALFLLLGDVAVGAVYQTGRFGRADTLYVWSILAGSAFGLLAGTMARLYASLFWAHHDTRTPLRCAAVRVATAAALGLGAALFLPGALGIETRWGVAGISLASGVGAWLELILLRRAAGRLVPGTGLPARAALRLWSAALAAAAAGRAVAAVAGHAHPVLTALLVLPCFGAAYLGAALALRVPEAAALVSRARSLARRDGAKTGP